MHFDRLIEIFRKVQPQISLQIFGVLGFLFDRNTGISNAVEREVKSSRQLSRFPLDWSTHNIKAQDVESNGTDKIIENFCIHVTPQEGSWLDPAGEGLICRCFWEGGSEAGAKELSYSSYACGRGGVTRTGLGTRHPAMQISWENFRSMGPFLGSRLYAV